MLFLPPAACKWILNTKNRQSKCVKNSTTALENKGNGITGCLARADLHTGADLSQITQKHKGERKKKCFLPLCMLMNPWHMLINTLLCLAAYQGLGLKTEGSFSLKVAYNTYWKRKYLYLDNLWIFVRKKSFLLLVQLTEMNCHLSQYFSISIVKS